MIRTMQATKYLISGAITTLWVVATGVLPASAQISDRQVNAVVEALRQAAPQTGTANDGLYSDWQIKPENIPRWSRLCIDRELTPTQFEASPATARFVVACVLRDVLQEQYADGGNNELVAVRRAAAWWMTGDPDQYTSEAIASYIQRVVRAYQQQVTAASPPPSPTPPSSSESSPSSEPAISPPQTTEYDRYMRAGYAATQQRDYDTALLYFKRALDERPNDTFAEQAIRNVETYRDRNSNSNVQHGSNSKEREFNKTQNLVFESAAEQHFQKLNPWF
jgi:hypothetical protein